jgi:hypothetical protein
MPRKLQNKAPLVGAPVPPNADVYRVLEVNINAENNSVHVFWGAYESQDDIVDNNVLNPAYVDAETTPDETEFITVVTPVADVKVAGEGVLYKDADFLALIAAPTLDGETIYDSIKRIAYAKLEADGLFPAGTDE